MQRRFLPIFKTPRIIGQRERKNEKDRNVNRPFSGRDKDFVTGVKKTLRGGLFLIGIRPDFLG
jgi:hypothetical protein